MACVDVTISEVEVVEPVGPSCRYFCIRPTNNEPYCCDDGSNRGGDRKYTT